MAIHRFPTTLVLTAIAIVFSGASIISDKTMPPAVSALIIVQAMSLIASPNHPHKGTALYIAAFLGAIILGHSTGLELFLGVFLITTITATGHSLLTALVIATITLGGFYTPATSGFTFELGAMTIFFTIIILSYLVGFWIHRNHRQHLATVRAQQEQRTHLSSLLHDTIAADLTSVIVRLEKLAIHSPEHRNELRGSAQTARDALKTTRKLLDTLNANLDSYPAPPLPMTLESTSQRLRDHGFHVTTETDLAIPVTMRVQESAVERVLKEAATNIIKHAVPESHVKISAVSHDHRVTITMTNSYTPAKRHPTATQRGLTNMSNTLQAVGGELSTQVSSNKWVTNIHVPLRST